MRPSKHTEEFKQEVARLSYQPDKSVRIVADELGVSRVALQNWRSQQSARRAAGARKSSAQTVNDQQIMIDAEEYRQLKRELELARQEPDI